MLAVQCRACRTGGGRIAEWEKVHPDEAAALWEEVTTDSRWDGVPPGPYLEKTMRIAYRQRVLEGLEQLEGAPV